MSIVIPAVEVRNSGSLDKGRACVARGKVQSILSISSMSTLHRRAMSAVESSPEAAARSLRVCPQRVHLIIASTVPAGQLRANRRCRRHERGREQQHRPRRPDRCHPAPSSLPGDHRRRRSCGERERSQRHCPFHSKLAWVCARACGRCEVCPGGGGGGDAGGKLGGGGRGRWG